MRTRPGSKNILIMNKNGKGAVSPLLQYAHECVELMIQMARIHRTLTPSGALALINDSIAGTAAQTLLMSGNVSTKLLLESNISLDSSTGTISRSGMQIKS